MRVSAARAAKLLGLGAVLVSATLWTGAAKASLITDDFTFSLTGTTVASGSFSYDSSLSGTSITSYGQLASFNISLPGFGTSYDLSFASNPANNYAYFDFNTATNSFVAGSVTGSSGTFKELMGAIDSGFTSGFFIVPPPPSQIVNYPITAVENYDTVTVSQAVPEPSTLALLGAAVLAFSFLLRRKRVPEALLAAEPEPSTLAFLGAAIAAFSFLLRRKHVAAAAAEVEGDTFHVWPAAV